MEIQPLEIKRLAEGGLGITWSDAAKNVLTSEKLRQNCPCALCRAKRGDTSHDTPLSPKKSMLQIVEHTKDEELRIEKIWAVGQYAIGVLWGDGHQTGIYTFDYLKELSGRTI